ncbi:MAG TPA: alkaline phosphatase family protein, partial [Acidimicrobiales bacterium]|nr:alkaline phosphatase family protein [Acidimicrobiales bacterium]
SADAGFYGPTALVPLAAPIVGMAATPDGRGYWLVGADGGIFAFGDARFLGSANGMHLDAPIVAIASTPDGGGYWLSAADGGVFAFGDARFVGSAHGARLSAPIVGMAAGPDGEGYALAAADGGVFAFGDEPYDGSAAPLRPRAKVVGIASGAARAASGGNAFCGSRSGPPATSKLLVIWEENASASSVYGNPAAPHLNTYAQECGRATDYVSLGHPSLPNYLEATSGTAYDQSPWTSDCAAASPGCQTANANIFEQVGPGGWKAYAQSMPSPCDRSDSGPYVARHNPAVYYSDLGAACASNDLNLGSLSAGALESDIAAGTLPVFATHTPDVNNDQHDGTLQEADAFLSSWIDELVAGPDYQSGRLAIAIVYDEGAGSGTDSPSVVPAVFMSQYVQPGTASNVAFTHYSLLAAAEDIAGVPRLGNAATAADLRAAFGF